MAYGILGSNKEILAQYKRKRLTMTDIRYDDKEHKYYKGDNEELISVTKIASEICGINTDYLAHNKDVKVAAEKGTSIHTELADYYDPILQRELQSDAAKSIAKYLEPDVMFMPEQIVWNAERGYAGTADLVHITGTTCHMIVDFKTMEEPNKKYCQIQLSLYRLALESMGYNCDETKLKVICPTGVIDLDPLTWDEIVALRRTELELDEDVKYQYDVIEQRLEVLSSYVEEYKALEEAYKAHLLEDFEKTNAKKYTGCRYKATYVEPSVRVSLDTKRLKAEQPDIYESYKKETKTSGFIKLMKNGEAND